MINPEQNEQERKHKQYYYGAGPKGRRAELERRGKIKFGISTIISAALGVAAIADVPYRLPLAIGSGLAFAIGYTLMQIADGKSIAIDDEIRARNAARERRQQGDIWHESDIPGANG